MDIDESSDNDTEEDAPYLRDPRDDEDTETDADAGADDDDDDDSSDESEESAAGSSDLEGPVVTPAIQISVKQAGVEIVSYYNTGMTAVACLLRRQSPLDVPKDTVDCRFHTRFQQDFYQTVILAKAEIASEAQWVGHIWQTWVMKSVMRWLRCVRTGTSRTLWGSRMIGTRR